MRTSRFSLLVLGALASVACGKTSSDAADAAALQPNLGTATIGPIDVGGGQEETVCIFKRLGTTEDIMATSFVADLAPGSHHLIVYRSTETTENLNPFPCVPFLGLTDGTEVPLMLVNKLHLEYDFPPNVGIVLPAGQMLKIEAHYINTTASQIEGQGTVQYPGAAARAGERLPGRGLRLLGDDEDRSPAAHQRVDAHQVPARDRRDERVRGDDAPARARDRREDSGRRRAPPAARRRPPSRSTPAPAATKPARATRATWTRPCRRTRRSTRRCRRPPRRR